MLVLRQRLQSINVLYIFQVSRLCVQYTYITRSSKVCVYFSPTRKPFRNVPAVIGNSRVKNNKFAFYYFHFLTTYTEQFPDISVLIVSKKSL